MKTLVMAIQKGGQGKTFATCHLAFAAQERGLRVAVIDLDPQRNASYTLAEYDCGMKASDLFRGDVDAIRAHFAERDTFSISLLSADRLLANLAALDFDAAVGSFRPAINALSEFFDVCFIDTPPTLGPGLGVALAVTNYVLSPFEVEAFSISGVGELMDTINTVRQNNNPEMQFVGMLPNRVDVRRPRHVSNLAGLQELYPQLVLPCVVGARDSIAEALGDKMPVWGVKKTAARVAVKEVRAMTNYVLDKMEIA